jgi:riboflavin kinase/FMN adenylyltransferase
VQILDDIEQLHGLAGSLHLAVGVFDGVHRGHAAVIGRATGRDGATVVVTFDPHPVRVLRPEMAPKQLSTLEHKEGLVAALGAEYMLVIPFDEERAKQEAADFVREIAGFPGVESVAVGCGFRFGKGRAGDLELLQSMGGQYGFSVEGVEPVVDADGLVISSTRIRAAVDAGDFALASDLLGREYSICGSVSRGSQIGRTMGFPTANISVGDEQLPPVGVYAVRVDLDGGSLKGVANFGFRPTVEQAQTQALLEVHILDFSEEIYDREVEVRFVDRIRGEQKFADIDTLKRQIEIDVRNARDLLS